GAHLAAFFGVRFEANTTDVFLDAGSFSNSFVGCDGITTITDNSTNELTLPNQFLANGPNVPNALGKTLSLVNGVVFPSAAATWNLKFSAHEVFLPNTTGVRTYIGNTET